MEAPGTNASYARCTSSVPVHCKRRALTARSHCAMHCVSPCHADCISPVGSLCGTLPHRLQLATGMRVVMNLTHFTSPGDKCLAEVISLQPLMLAINYPARPCSFATAEGVGAWNSACKCIWRHVWRKVSIVICVAAMDAGSPDPPRPPPPLDREPGQTLHNKPLETSESDRRADLSSKLKKLLFGAQFEGVRGLYWGLASKLLPCATLKPATEQKLCSKAIMPRNYS